MAENTTTVASCHKISAEGATQPDQSPASPVLSASLDQLKAKVTCPRCHELFGDRSREPRLLPCLHHVCSSCAESLIVPESSEGDEDSVEDPQISATPTSTLKMPPIRGAIKCPQCDQISHIGARGGLKAIQTSLVAHELAEMYRLARKCDSKNVICDQCTTEATAVEYCYNCTNFACDFCCQAHKRWTGYSNHRTVTIAELSENLKRLKLPSSRDVLCSIHRHKRRLFCETCQELICQDCTVRPHNGHNFDLITEDIIAAHEKRITDSLTPLSELLRELDENAKSHTRFIEGEVAEAKRSVSTAFRKVQDTLEARKKELFAQIDESARRPSAKLREHNDHLQRLQSQLQRCQEFVEECSMASTSTAMLSVEQTISHHIERVQEEVEQVSPVSEDLSIQFRCRKELMKLAPSFGEVTCNASTYRSSDQSSEHNSETSEPLVSHSWENLKSQVVHPFCRSLFLNSEHLYVSEVFDLSSSFSPSVSDVGIASPPVPSTALASVRTLKFLGIPVRIIEGVTRPSGIALGNYILVTEYGEHQVSMLDYRGRKLRAFGCKGHRKGQFMYPHSITAIQDGKLLVSDENARVQMLSASGRFSKSVGSKGHGMLQFRDPAGIAVGKDSQVFVCERKNHRIHILNDDFTFRTVIGRMGEGPGEFNFPSDVAVDSHHGNLYVADTLNNRIQVLTEDGAFILQFGRKGVEPGQLHCPSHVCIDLDNFVYVTEIKNHRVSVFSCTGEFIMTFGLEGNRLGQFVEPRGIAVDGNRMLYVCDFGNNRIQVFK